MNDYNGFTGSQRMITQHIMDEMQRRGIINWKDQPCEICRGTGGCKHAHLEDYSNPWDFHTLCIECHMKLHMRFRFPGFWVKHLIDVKNGYIPIQHNHSKEWFSKKKGKFKLPEFETLDPALIGNEWYHKLPMERKNKNKFRHYDK